MIKQCEICGKEFEPLKGGESRKYCFECSPSYTGPNGSHSDTTTALRKAMKKEAVRRRGGKCELCGYDKFLGALQFHHKDPSKKEFSLGKSGYTHNFSRYMEEVDKCLLVCANCHAELH